MSPTGLGMSMLTAALMLSIQSTPASALAWRTWVSSTAGTPGTSDTSGTGNDANPCTRDLPCKTFAHALTQTEEGGEINVVAPGDGFGAVTITKSVTIDGGSSFAGVLGGASYAIQISAGSNDRVTLRNLSLNGKGTSGVGIIFKSGGVLHIENCSISNFGGWGIQFEPNANNPLAALYVENTTIAGNGSGSAGGGIHIAPQGDALVSAFLNQVRVEHNRDGITVDGRNGKQGNTFLTTFISVAVQGSAAVGNTLNGFTAISATGKTPTVMTLDRVIAANNVGAGVHADGANSSILIGGSTLTLNRNRGISATPGATTISFGDNKIGSNFPTEGSPIATPGLK